MLKAVEWRDNAVIILDQRALPERIEYLTCRSHEEVAKAIENLAIRGAPAIGIATAMGIALASLEIKTSRADTLLKQLEGVFQRFLNTRPTAVNIKWAVDRVKSLLSKNRNLKVEEIRALLVEEANRILSEDVEVNRKIGLEALPLFRENVSVLTYCNAGALATGGYGTATAPMYLAKERGIDFKVYACETRPVLQGARITAYELKEAKIDVTLICDNTAGLLLRKGMIDFAIVGTDRTVRNGDVANKIGTYSLAVLCKENRVPFYVAAPTSSIDLSIRRGEDIPIEERASEEVTSVKGVRIAPHSVKALNFAFDITPAKYVTAIITEKGVFQPKHIKYIFDESKVEQLRILL